MKTHQKNLIKEGFACVSFLSQQSHFNSINCMDHSFAPSYIPIIHISLWPDWGDTKQIPHFLPVLWPKCFNMLFEAIKWESPEEDRDEWAKKRPEREGSEGLLSEAVGHTVRESQEKPKVLVNGPLWADQNIFRFLNGKVNMPVVARRQVLRGATSSTSMWTNILIRHWERVLRRWCLYCAAKMAVNS